MTTDKVFEKADLLLFFNEDYESVKPIGGFSSIQEEGRGDLFTNTRREHQVRATTRVWFCEKHRFAVVEQTVIVSESGARVLGKDHPFRDPSLPKLSLIRGGVCHNSADLTRESVRLADEWRDEMALHVPIGVIDTTTRRRAVADEDLKAEGA